MLLSILTPCFPVLPSGIWTGMPSETSSARASNCTAADSSFLLKLQCERESPRLLSALRGQGTEQRKTHQAYCEPVLYLTCSAEFLNSIHIKSSLCCFLIPSELSAFILSNSAPHGWCLLIILMELPQKVPLQMNPQKSQFIAILQARLSKSDIRIHPITWPALAGLAEPKPAMQQKGTSTWWGNRKLGIHFSQTGAQTWQQSEVTNFLCSELEI